MSETNLPHDRKVPVFDDDMGDDGAGPGLLQPLTETEIDDVLSNAAMTVEEKRARLEQFTGRMSDGATIDRGSEFEPLELQIRDALSMLADGGHVYGASRSTAIDRDVDGDARTPDHQGDSEPR